MFADEPECAGSASCEYPSLSCDALLQRSKCIPPERLCDAVPDCQDGADEGLLCAEDHCATALDTCEFACHNSPDGHRCACPPGQQLDAGLRNCTEARPCEAWGACSQLCRQAVFRIRIHRIHVFFGFPDPDPLIRCMDSDPDSSIIVQKSYYFVTLFDFLSLKNNVSVPSKSNKQKKLCKKLVFCWHLEGQRRK
jgi:hypothetical protein